MGGHLRCVWLYHRFTLSFREIELLMAACGIEVSNETIRALVHAAHAMGPHLGQGACQEPEDAVALGANAFDVATYD